MIAGKWANSGSRAWRCISCRSPALSSACCGAWWWAIPPFYGSVLHPRTYRSWLKHLPVPCNHIPLSDRMRLPMRCGAAARWYACKGRTSLLRVFPVSLFRVCNLQCCCHRGLRMDRYSMPYFGMDTGEHWCMCVSAFFHNKAPWCSLFSYIGGFLLFIVPFYRGGSK